jgi:hypothetical protein
MKSSNVGVTKCGSIFVELLLPRTKVQILLLHLIQTIVPMSIVRQFGLTEDEKLDWMIKTEGGELIIHFKPIKNQTK